MERLSLVHGVSKMADSQDHDEIEVARRVAGIIGPGSGAALAVADYDRRSAEGENPICFSQNRLWLVMPETTYTSISR